jgi:hypothetical protein
VVGGISHSQSMCQAEIRSKLRETISPQPINEGYRPGFFLLFFTPGITWEAMAGHQIRKSPKLKGGSGWSPPHPVGGITFRWGGGGNLRFRSAHTFDSLRWWKV